ncbi:MarR family winged helix-turn-helix transcriptional regulator [Actinoplanes sp. N902-109]|uniref:MarR family winged helix-turn-helix transcriptional regulator n=1 Tax=Actinoplanes sp. (strain N902-109) TaxID=649831 RepID=UPI00032952D0|nr:MarR family transcriptional regulator [Actinoplanes sp. N902-109]AGL18347.1 MarR family transcriptional regulator [Actinoplanes sp. N902-109]
MTSSSAAQAARDVRVVVGRLRRRLRDVADIGDLTPSQTSVLSRLSKEGPASASDLAAAEHVRPQSIAATLAVLEERQLIERRPDPRDGRRQLIDLTAPGHELIDGSRQARQEWLARALDERCTEAERQTIIAAMALLERLGEQ